MSVLAIYLNRVKAGPLTTVDAVTAVAGRGLEGNRLFAAEPGGIEPDREVTLVEAEAAESLPRDHDLPFTAAESRRNLVTRGVDLNALVGRTFRVGPVLLKGIRPCDPCRHLEALTRPGVLKALAGRGGLRAQILEGGPIRVGDPITPVEAAAPVETAAVSA